MATLIKNINGDAYKVCLTDAHLSALHILPTDYSDNIYTKVTITDAEANDLRHETKWYRNNAFVTVEDRTGVEAGIKLTQFLDKTSFDNHKTFLINNLDTWLEKNASNAMASDIKTYRDALAAVDSSTISFPLAHNMVSYMESEGHTAFHPLQLP